MSAVRLASLGLVLAAACATAGSVRAEEPPVPKSEGEKAPAKPEEQAKALLVQFKSKDPSRRMDAAVKAKSLQRKELIKPLAALLKDDFDFVRSAAIEALGARMGEADVKAAAKALAGRLPSLSKTSTQKVELLTALTALHDLAHPTALKALFADMTPTTHPDIVRARCMAVGNIPHKDAVEGLIKLMSSGRNRGGKGGARGNAAAGLRYATGENLGHDPDVWRAWWKENKKSFDFEAAWNKREEDREAKADRERRKKEAQKRKEKRKRGKGGDSEKRRKKKKKPKRKGDEDPPKDS